MSELELHELALVLHHSVEIYYLVIVELVSVEEQDAFVARYWLQAVLGD